MSANISNSSKEATTDTGSTPTDLEAASTIVSSLGPPYTVFNGYRKFLIIAVSAYGGFISPLSGSIYLPALTNLASEFNVTPSQINLTVTTYMIFQGISPLFVGSFADGAGYRPAFLVCFVIYLFAKIALACSNSYVALMVLRCLQSMGSSGTIALRNGVIASVFMPGERGTVMSIVGIGNLVAPAFGPSLGGALVANLGWRWIFWFLAILSATCLITQLLLVPETNRNIVGNGSLPPYEWWNRSPFDIPRGHNITKEEYVQEREKAELKPREKVGWPNPWPALRLIGEKDTALTLLPGALCYGAQYSVLTSLPILFETTYGLNTVQQSLCFISLGSGAAISAMVNGRLLDWNWKRIGARHGIKVDKEGRQDLRQFPIELARLQHAIPFVVFGCFSLISYGWVLHYKTAIAAPLILMFFVATGVVSGFNSLQNLSIDQHPTEPSTITAAGNITRCLLGAAATALIVPMIEKMGVGCCFTLIGLLLLTTIPFMLLLMRYGQTWREERRVRLEKEKEELERKKEGQKVKEAANS